MNRFTLRGPLVYIPSPNHMLNFQLANILTLLICFKYYCLQCYVNIYECFHFFQTLAEENDIEALRIFSIADEKKFLTAKRTERI